MTNSVVHVARGKIWEDGLFDLLMMMHAENGVVSVNPDKARERLQWGLMGHRSIIGVIGSPAGVEGAICLSVAGFWYSDDQHLEDLWNFVHPGHRRSDHAKTLLDFSMLVSDQLGIPLLMGVLCPTTSGITTKGTDRTAAKVRLYERRLPHDAAGALFLYRPKVAA